MLLLITKKKLKVIYISNSEYNDSKSHDSSYELPDGKVINVGSQKFRCPESLFKPLSMGR